MCETRPIHQSDFSEKKKLIALEQSLGTADAVHKIAADRWFKTLEIKYLLNPETTPLIITRNIISAPLRSGTLLLYDRNITRRYKSDGGSWIKKRKTNKVREDHVKLRIDGKDRISGFYAHSEDTLTLHRRSYRALSSQESIDDSQCFILVHYLDSTVASAEKSKVTATRGKRKLHANPAIEDAVEDKLDSDSVPVGSHPYAQAVKSFFHNALLEPPTIPSTVFQMASCSDNKMCIPHVISMINRLPDQTPEDTMKSQDSRSTKDDSIVCRKMKKDQVRCKVTPGLVGCEHGSFPPFLEEALKASPARFEADFEKLWVHLCNMFETTN